MFESDEFLNDFYLTLQKRANEISSGYLDKLKSSKFGNNKSGTGFENSYRKVIGKIASEQVFSIVFETDSLKAFITEYGSGSLMAGSELNPYLSDYLGKKGYNPARSKSIAGANKVRSWGRGKYFTFNWDSENGGKYIERDGGNRPAGIDIESQGTGIGGFHKGQYTPRKPNFILRQILIDCQNDLLQEVEVIFTDMINDDKYYSGISRGMLNITVDWRYDV